MTTETVTAFYRQTEMGQAVHNQGLEQGLEQGAARTLIALLRSRFGDHAEIPTIAEHLAQSLDDDARIQVVIEAGSLDDLADWLSPPGPAR